jgi:hypothetical protein
MLTSTTGIDKNFELNWNSRTRLQAVEPLRTSGVRKAVVADMRAAKIASQWDGSTCKLARLRKLFEDSDVEAGE